MFPRKELSELAAARVEVRRRIAAHRAECVAAAARASVPLVWLDRGLAWWRRISPLTQLAVVPLALYLKRKLAPDTGIVAATRRWLPVLAAALRGAI